MIRSLAIAAALALCAPACGKKTDKSVTDEPKPADASRAPSTRSPAPAPDADARAAAQPSADAAPPVEPPVRKATKCEDLERQVERAIAALDRSCKADTDCEATGFGCPFGCTVPVRKGADTSIVEKKADRYHNMCGQCKYRCKRMDVACVKGTCTAVEPAGAANKTLDLTAP